jgi:pyruvate kinase
MARRTKIVATIGPASRDPATVRALIGAGIDVARLNLAHGSATDHEQTASTVRAGASAAGRIVGILADLPGPKMRTGPVAGDEITLEAGNRFVLTPDDVAGDPDRVSVSLADCGELVDIGDEIFLADGAIVLKVVDEAGGDVVTEVVRGGLLRSRKGMHIPGAERRLPAFTDEDREALDVALALKVDLVGLSFIRDAAAVGRVRELLPKRGPRPLLVAKIETRAAVEHLADIVPTADAVMVARGDLGIQMPLFGVPLLQKDIIHACNRAGRPVITATQMLESMTHSPMPTRAEVADVANAVLDGTDALMLSEETAVGDYPVETVRTMSETAERAESRPTGAAEPDPGAIGDDPVSWAVAHAAVEAAEDLKAAAIVCPTQSGSTPRRVAAYRPTMPVIGLSKQSGAICSLALLRGVTPLGVRGDDPSPREAREDVERAMVEVASAGLVHPGDLVVIVAGSPGPRAGRTDYMRVVRASIAG